MMTDAMYGPFTLAEEIERFDPNVPSGRRAETLIKTDHLRVVLVTMQAGATLQEHSAPGTITIQPLRGRFTVNMPNDNREISVGSLLALDANTRHTVQAVNDGAFLLTIAWPNRSASDASRT